MSFSIATVFGGRLSELPQPIVRRFAPGAIRAADGTLRVVVVALGQFESAAAHVYADIEEESNPVWDAAAGAWRNCWNDPDIAGRTVRAKFDTMDEAKAFVLETLRLTFPLHEPRMKHGPGVPEWLAPIVAQRRPAKPLKPTAAHRRLLLALDAPGVQIIAYRDGFARRDVVTFSGRPAGIARPPRRAMVDRLEAAGLLLRSREMGAREEKWTITDAGRSIAAEVRLVAWRVEFRDVGRRKDSWDTFFADRPSLDELEEEIARRGCLLSRGIEVSSDGTLMRGTIFAGMQTVGRWDSFAPSKAEAAK